MKNKNKINEGEKFELTVTQDDLKDPQTTQKLAQLQKANKNLEVTLSKDKEMGQSISDLFETDGIIEPQDQATIKYLSNVKDVNTGEVSQPFTIADKNYQMVRGIYPDGNVDMAVYCLDDIDDLGNNIIHSIEEFEQKVALPMKERLELESQKLKSDKDTYEGYKHFFVNKKTNEVKKFKTIEEMLSCNKMEEEEYMPRTKFKRHMTEKLFGRNRINELGMDQANLEPAQGSQNGEESDEEMNVKAKKLMDMIMKRIPSNVITTIKTPIAQREVIAAFAEMIGVPRNGLSSLIGGLKDMSKQQVTNENKTVTKKSLEESLGKKRNVIKTLKVKDIK